MSKTKLTLISNIVVAFVLAVAFYAMLNKSYANGYENGFSIGHNEAQKDISCAQAEINYNMALILDNPKMISFCKETLDKCCEKGDLKWQIEK